MQRARLRRTAIFHVTSGSTAPSPREVMRLYSEGARRGGEGREGGEETETKTKSLRSRINFNWITVNIVSAYVEASHSSPLLLRGGCAPLRAKSRLFHLITN